MVTPWLVGTSWTEAARRRAGHCRTPATPSLHKTPRTDFTASYRHSDIMHQGSRPLARFSQNLPSRGHIVMCMPVNPSLVMCAPIMLTTPAYARLHLLFFKCIRLTSANEQHCCTQQALPEGCDYSTACSLMTALALTAQGWLYVSLTTGVQDVVL